MGKIRIMNTSNRTIGLLGKTTGAIVPGENLVEQADWDSSKEHFTFKMMIKDGVLKEPAAAAVEAKPPPVANSTPPKPPAPTSDPKTEKTEKTEKPPKPSAPK